MARVDCVPLSKLLIELLTTVPNIWKATRRKVLPSLLTFLGPVPTHFSGTSSVVTLFQEAFPDSHLPAELAVPLGSDSPGTYLCHHPYHLCGNCLFTCLAPSIDCHFLWSRGWKQTTCWPKPQVCFRWTTGPLGNISMGC